MTKFLLLALACLARADERDEWAAFKQNFGKSYSSPNDEEERFGIFRSNLRFINSENQRGHNYTLGINQFSDLTPDEFVAQHTGLQKPSALWGDLPSLGNHSWDGAELPSEVDWTQKGAVTPVKNQGQCGSCWAFSAIGAIEGAWQIASGKLVSLAEQQLVDCPTNPLLHGCSGGLMSFAFDYAESNALCTEASYPYKAKGGQCAASSCSTGVAKGRVKGYKGLAPIAHGVLPATEQSLMSALAQQPVSIGIEADKAVFQHYKSGVLSSPCGSMVDHGVLAVGYGTDPQGGDYWKVKNSWAATWGDEGYVRLKRGKSRAGECGCLTSPSYPVVSASEIVV